MTLTTGDCLEEMARMPDESVDAIVTDPPYGLSSQPDIAEVLRHWLAGDDYQHRGGGFMGKTWDSFVPGPAIWKEAYRVLKPGGHLTAFFGTRTYDLGVIAVRLAGFEVRDTLAYCFGSGFPKSLDVSKALDRAAGAEREVVGQRKNLNRTKNRAAAGAFNASHGGMMREDRDTFDDCPIPATPEAQKWQGFGTALKPAWESIVLARKPLEGTVVQNVGKYGTGALNIDGCRVATDDSLGGGAEKTVAIEGKGEGWQRPWMRDEDAVEAHAARVRANVEKAEAQGRWPANLILDEEAARRLDEQSGESTSRVGGVRTGKPDGFLGSIGSTSGTEHNDTGGASRFFYTAKASSAERNAGLSEFEKKAAGVHDDDAYVWPKNGDGSPRNKKVEPRANHHPTVKPIDLMRWLVRLVTPPGGRVLDPFTGSGTTGIAAHLEGMEFIGIEREPEYRAIAEARIEWWSQYEGDTAEILAKAGLSEKAEQVHAEAGQMTLGAG